jgi:hypothetical protein
MTNSNWKIDGRLYMLAKEKKIKKSFLVISEKEACYLCIRRISTQSSEKNIIKSYSNSIFDSVLYIYLHLIGVCEINSYSRHLKGCLIFNAVRGFFSPLYCGFFEAHLHTLRA